MNLRTWFFFRPNSYHTLILLGSTYYDGNFLWWWDEKKNIVSDLITFSVMLTTIPNIIIWNFLLGWLKLQKCTFQFKNISKYGNQDATFLPLLDKTSLVCFGWISEQSLAIVTTNSDHSNQTSGKTRILCGWKTRWIR